MKVAIIQTPTIGSAMKENFAWVKEALESSISQKADTILLPELWNTGYVPQDLVQGSNFLDKEIEGFLSSLAREKNINLVAGSLAKREEMGLVNQSIIFNRKGEVQAQYKKVHLFAPSGEDRVFCAGSKLCQFTLDGISMALVNCHDLRFPEWIRLSSMGVQVLLVPSAWAYSRIDQMHFLARTRAYENQVFVLVANATRMPGHKALSGGQSIAFDPYGRELLRLDTRPQITTIDLDLSLIEETKRIFDLWAGRRPDLYRGLDQ